MILKQRTVEEYTISSVKLLHFYNSNKNEFILNYFNTLGFFNIYLFIYSV